MMAGEPEIEDDVLELGEDDLADNQGADTADSGEANDEIEVPTFGDLADGGEDDTPLVKQLRDRIKELSKAPRQAEAEQQIVVGDKPTLESCEYDEDKFEAELDAYKERKRQADAQANKGKEAETKAAEQWNETLSAYTAKKAALPYADKDEAEANALAVLSVPQQRILAQVAADPAKLIYALGRNPAKLTALAAINVTDIATIARFGAATGKLEGEMKMMKRKPTVEPDTVQRGSGSLVSVTKSDLEKKADKAQAAGNFDEYRRIMKEVRKKAA